jgi:hypothetical protein
MGASAAPTAPPSNGSYSHSTPKGDDESSNSSSPKPSFTSTSDCCGISGQLTLAGGVSKYQMSQANGRQDRHVVQVIKDSKFDDVFMLFNDNPRRIIEDSLISIGITDEKSL